MPSQLLMTETPLRLCTLQHVWMHLGRVAAKSPDDSILLLMIDQRSYDAMLLMNRGIEKKARVEYFDTHAGQREWWVAGAPIDTTVTITARNNTDEPRDFTDSADDIDSDDVIVDPERAAAGRVYIAQELGENPYSLYLSYTGGMATITGSWGWDGVAANTGAGGAGVLTSAVGTFKTDGITAGCKVIVQNGTNKNAYATAKVVASVDSDTQITLTTAWSGAATGMNFYIVDSAGSSIIHTYRSLAKAIARQVANDWARKDRTGITAESLGGGSVTWVPPDSWLNDSKATVLGHQVRVI